MQVYAHNFVAALGTLEVVIPSSGPLTELVRSPMYDGGGEGEAAIAETEEVEARWKAVEAYHGDMEQRWSSLVLALLRNCAYNGSSSDQRLGWYKMKFAPLDRTFLAIFLAPAYLAEKMSTILGHVRCYLARLLREQMYSIP